LLRQLLFYLFFKKIKKSMMVMILILKTLNFATIPSFCCGKRKNNFYGMKVATNLLLK